MDIIDAITSIQAIDLLVFFGLFAMFILGFMQGIIRRLLGIASILVALIIAAQLQAPLGNFLAVNWTQYPSEYNHMIAFGTVFLALSIAATVAIQLFYRPAPLFHQYPALDEVLGGVLGVLQGLLILACFFIITDPFYTGVGKDYGGLEFPFIHEIHDVFEGSITGSLIRDRIIPSILFVLGWVFPAEVRETFAR